MADIMDNGRRVIMCHYPIIEWDGYFRGSYLVYGHIKTVKYIILLFKITNLYKNL